MTQKVLDPQQPATNGTWKATRPLPKKVREFARYPNIESWKPGDLLLLEALNPPLISRAIQSTQENGGYLKEHSRWHHAAIYMGNEYICEATFFGVKYRTLDHYIPTHRLRVRRNNNLSDRECWLIAINALSKLKSTYSFRSIAGIYLKSLWGFWREGNSLSKPGAVICSELYAKSYSMATSRIVTNAIPAIPAELSCTNQLEDIDVCWRLIK